MCAYKCVCVCAFVYTMYIACLCQSIEINNNKHAYRQSQVRKPTGSVVEWAECSLIIGTDCWVQVLAWSSIAQSVCEWAFSLLANMFETSRFEPCIQQMKTTCLLSFRISLACARASKLTTTNMHLGHKMYQGYRFLGYRFLGSKAPSMSGKLQCLFT